MTASTHRTVAQVSGASAQVHLTAGTITLDESWSPFGQATITVPLAGASGLAVLDPRAMPAPRVHLTSTQRFSEPVPASAMTALWAGKAASALTAAYGGKAARRITAAFDDAPFNDSGTRPSTRRVFDLGVRRRRINHGAATVTVELATDEALLQDAVLVSTVPAVPVTATVRAAVTLALSRIGAALQHGTDDAPLEADAAVWEPGTSAWDYVRPLVDVAGLRLWCDERRRWWLAPPQEATGSVLSLSSSSLRDLDDEVSRDDGWYDGVVLRYRWADSNGAEQLRYDLAGPETAQRARVIEYRRRWPGPGAAAELLRRAAGRGRAMTASLVANYSATPGQGLTITSPGAPIQVGATSRVVFQLDDDTMQITSRDLTDTPLSAWTLIPAGQAWTDSPTGASWNGEVVS